MSVFIISDVLAWFPLRLLLILFPFETKKSMQRYAVYCCFLRVFNVSTLFEFFCGGLGIIGVYIEVACAPAPPWLYVSSHRKTKTRRRRCVCENTILNTHSWVSQPSQKEKMTALEVFHVQCKWTKNIVKWVARMEV